MSTKPYTGRPATPPSGMSGYRLFRIFGFDVKLNLTWLLLALLITWTLAAGMFPADYPGLAPQSYWWMGIAGALGILLSIVFHELSHSLVARRFGLPIRGITLFIFGGVAEMEEEPVSPKVEFVMAVAGPLASLLLALLLFQFERLALAQQWPVAIIGVIHYLVVVNIVVALFNLVPAFPLDGGRMLRAALWHWKKDLRGATRIASQVGAGFGLVLMILGGLGFLQGNFIGGMWWFLIGAFVRLAANASYQQVLVRELLSDKPVREFMNRTPVSVSPELSVAQLLEDYVYQHHFKLYPVVENGRLLGCITVDAIKALPPERRAQLRVRDLLIPSSPENTVAPDTSAAELAARMTRPDGSGRYMVAEAQRLLGIIALKDLKEYISLKLELESPRR